MTSVYPGAKSESADRFLGPNPQDPDTCEENFFNSFTVPRVSRTSITAYVAAQEEPSKSVRTFRAEKTDRFAPLTAGALTGAVGGALALIVAECVQRLGMPGGDLVEGAGSLLSGGRVGDGVAAALLAFVAAIVGGAAVGGMFARATRHLRKFIPLVLGATAFFLSAWTALHAFVIPASAREAIPFGPSAVGLLAYAIVASLQLPLRMRRDVDRAPAK